MRKSLSICSLLWFVISCDCGHWKCLAVFLCCVIWTLIMSNTSLLVRCVTPVMWSSEWNFFNQLNWNSKVFFFLFVCLGFFVRLGYFVWGFFFVCLWVFLYFCFLFKPDVLMFRVININASTVCITAVRWELKETKRTDCSVYLCKTLRITEPFIYLCLW